MGRFSTLCENLTAFEQLMIFHRHEEPLKIKKSIKRKNIDPADIQTLAETPMRTKCLSANILGVDALNSTK